MNFERFSDEELCEKAKEGDGKAENYLLNKYKNLVRGKAKTLYLLGGDREDLIQEGMIGLFMAVRDFDKTKNASFSTFANLVCERRMYNAIKAGQAGKNIPLNTYISLYAGHTEGENSDDIKLINNLRANSHLEPEGFVVDKENTVFLLEKLRSYQSLRKKCLIYIFRVKTIKKLPKCLREVRSLLTMPWEESRLNLRP